MATAHIIGAGLAGLSAAVRLTDAGCRVVIHEATGHAGGRCRSFFDETLDAVIDNGNHLMLSGNRSAMAFLTRIGARDSVAGPEDARFPFVDLATGERWEVRPNAGLLPWWIFAPKRRVAGTSPLDYLAALKLFFAGDATIGACFSARGRIYERFWDPLAVAVLNAPSDVAAARLMAPVLLETFGRGMKACRPLIARDGLSESLVSPAVRLLEACGAEIRYGERCTGVEVAGKRVTGVAFSRGREAVNAQDLVVVAVPPSSAHAILPGLSVPQGAFPIVNVHYRLEQAVASPGAPELLGLVNGVAHWMFLRGTIASVTVSAAEELAQASANDIGRRVWNDVSRALGLGGDVPPHRVVKERRATFAQIPSELARRPGPITAWTNLVLAGDWTQTGLPATIEGAIRSGERAAAIALRDCSGRTGADHSTVSPDDPKRLNMTGAVKGA